MVHKCVLCIAALLPVIISFAIPPLYPGSSATPTLYSSLSHKAQTELLNFFIEKTNVLFTYNENLETEAFYYAKNRLRTVRPRYAYEIAFFNQSVEPVNDVVIAQSVVDFWENETLHFGTDWQMLHRYDWVGCGMDLNETALGFFICFFA